MDRCHRIGQSRPVLVFRLATAHSVEGRMLAAAAGKLALEAVVMKRGAFKEVVDKGDGKKDKEKNKDGLTAEQLLQLIEHVSRALVRFVCYLGSTTTMTIVQAMRAFLR